MTTKCIIPATKSAKVGKANCTHHACSCAAVIPALAPPAKVGTKHVGNGRRLFASIVRQLLGAGYQPGVPAWLLPDNEMTDRRVVSRSRCENCRERAMDARFFHNSTSKRFKVVGVCRCGVTKEF